MAKPYQIIPSNGYALIALDEIKAFDGAIARAETASKGRSQKGKIVALPKTNITDKGVELPMEWKVGDTVLFGEYSGEEMEYEGTSYRLLELMFIRGRLVEEGDADFVPEKKE